MGKKSQKKREKAMQVHFKRVLQARYDAASTSPDNERHWAMADGLSADAANSPDVRDRIRKRARYEMANNSYASGIALTLSGDTIGTGPRLEIGDESATDGIEEDFLSWSRAVRLPEKLRTMRIAKLADGEAFALLTTNPKIEHDVKLDIALIESDKVYTEFGEQPGVVDGIEFDRFGNPAFYWVGPHPGDMSVDVLQWEKIPSKQIIHWFRQTRPGQHRGVSELTPTLPLFAQLRRYTLAVLAAAETAADFAAVIYTDAPAGGEAAQGTAFELLDIEKNSATVMPSGWKMSQFKAEQPTTQYDAFKREILGEVGRALQMPVNIVTGDSSRHNYASGRLDHQVYHRAIQLEQSDCEGVVLSKIYRDWMREYGLVKRIDVSDLRPKWYWDGFEHVDPVKEATAQKIRLELGTTSLQRECARQGLDWRTIADERIEAQKYIEENGGAVADSQAEPDVNQDDSQ